MGTQTFGDLVACLRPAIPYLITEVLSYKEGLTGVKQTSELWI